MSRELQDRIHEAVAQLERELPLGDIDEEKVKRCRELVDRMRGRSTQMKEGYIVDPFAQSSALNDLRELLALCRDVIVPYAMRQQVANLRAVAALAGNVK